MIVAWLAAVVPAVVEILLICLVLFEGVPALAVLMVLAVAFEVSSFFSIAVASVGIVMVLVISVKAVMVTVVAFEASSLFSVGAVSVVMTVLL